jgi:imidazolonepropionase-like amidohydrolase
MNERSARTALSCLLTAIAFLLGAAHAVPSLADEAPPGQILFVNVNVFDGRAEQLATGRNVLVENNLIKTVSAEAIDAPNARVIDGQGRTLMPGLIDLHSHMLANGDAGLADLEANFTWEDLAIRAGAMAKLHLMEGFTTIRDMGGACGGLRRQIDAGVIEGPRVYPACAWIGPPGGHSDFRNYTMPQTPGVSQTERLGIAVNVNGADDVTAVARQNFMQGATQIKIMQTGGVSSLFDPWQLNGLNEDEIRAAVAVADNYGSYVGAHSYSKDAILRALELGVKTIEHGFMFDGEIAKLMRKKKAYLITQMTSQAPELAEIDALQDPRTAYKLQTAQAAFADYVKNVKRYKPKFGFMIDCVGGPETCRKQIGYEKHLHADFFGNHHLLVAATSTAGEIVAMSGPAINPYIEGKLGVVEEGAYADLLLVDGNPLEDISVIGAVPEWHAAPPRDGVQTIRIIMKDGVIYKDTL